MVSQDMHPSGQGQQGSDPFPGRQPSRLLLVDDEHSLLEIGTFFLEKGGRCQVTTTDSARGALELFRDRAIDVIVSDYQMPGMDGLALLKEVRADDPDLPFILFTGKGREEVAIEAMKYGADSYVQKGGDTRVQYAVLVYHVERAIERREAAVALHKSEARFRAVAGDQTTLICSLLPDGTYLFVNDAYCRFYGRSAGELIGHCLSQEVPAGELWAVWAHIQVLSPVCPVNSFEQIILIHDGSLRRVQWREHAIFAPGSVLCEYLLIGRTVPDLAEAEETPDGRPILSGEGTSIRAV
jgi:PAS domain S-box-containing protein